MRQLSTIFLLFIVFVQAFSSLVIQAGYSLNKEYISKVLCINKEKPKLDCSGKCFLSKKLKQQEKEDKQARGGTREKFELQVFFLPKQYCMTAFALVSKARYRQHDSVIANPFLIPVFHPPTI
ncbi:MAG TPA: hypothetical protein VM935_15505 [Chitinophagaceae bacterium]|nr:hypothetical protein [Chitinophagaceae bacterium]